MRTVFIILMFAAAFLALFEQSKANPNVLIMIVAMVVFVIGLMRLMAKVPSKNSRENDVEDESDV